MYSSTFYQFNKIEQFVQFLFVSNVESFPDAAWTSLSDALWSWIIDADCGCLLVCIKTSCAKTIVYCTGSGSVWVCNNIFLNKFSQVTSLTIHLPCLTPRLHKTDLFARQERDPIVRFRGMDVRVCDAGILIALHETIHQTLIFKRGAPERDSKWSRLSSIPKSGESRLTFQVFDAESKSTKIQNSLCPVGQGKGGVGGGGVA